MTTTETESPCDFRCGYVSSGRDLHDHIVWEHQPCAGCGGKPHRAESAMYDDNRAVTHKPDCPRLQPGYVYPATGSGYAPYDGPEPGRGETVRPHLRPVRARRA